MRQVERINDPPKLIGRLRWWASFADIFMCSFTGSRAVYRPDCVALNWVRRCMCMSMTQSMKMSVNCCYLHDSKVHKTANNINSLVIQGV